MRAAGQEQAVIVGLTALDVVQSCGATGFATLRLRVSAAMNRTHAPGGDGDDMHLFVSNVGVQPNTPGTACTVYAFNPSGCVGQTETDGCADVLGTATLTCNAPRQVTVKCLSNPEGLLQVPVCHAWNPSTRICSQVDSGLDPAARRCGCRNGEDSDSSPAAWAAACRRSSMHHKVSGTFYITA
jgi:hypothetical protein